MRKVVILWTYIFIVLVSSFNYAKAESSYCEDRAKIENLMARYAFALDFNDAEAYASTFTEDGVLDSGAGIKKGHKEIKSVIALMNSFTNNSKTKEVRRHIITNIVLKVDGDRASGKAYWFSVKKDSPEKQPVFISFGHYDDEYKKVNGEWLFSKRKIYNEKRPNRAAKGPNPAW